MNCQSIYNNVLNIYNMLNIDLIMMKKGKLIRDDFLD